MAKWVLDQAVVINNISEIIPSIAQKRGFVGQAVEQLISPDYKMVYKVYDQLPNVSKAVRRIAEAISAKQNIVIYGDYDIDGVSATTLMYGALKDSGAKISYYIPDRFEEGYGLNSNALLDLANAGAELVISVDCGITSVEEIKLAKSRGLDVIVTDHHNLPDVLPSDAVALVNPKLTPTSSLYDLAGVGVVFMLVVALQQADVIKLSVGQEKWLLDLVALGTICDVVPLTGLNRLLAHYGLIVMQMGRRKGLKALATVADVEISNVNAEDVGFRFGPRLNAAGRLEHAQQAIELLLSDDMVEAHKIATKLQALNHNRQLLTEAIYNEASEYADDCLDDKVIVLSSNKWSHGIIGIVASRLVEKTGKPVVLFCEVGEIAKGSARSPRGFNIIEAITTQAKLLDRFGGHAYAAGMSLPASKINEFRQGLNDFAVIKRLTVVEPELTIDAILSSDLLTLESYSQIQRLGPFGQDNIEPILTTTLLLNSFKLVGRELKHLQLRFLADNTPLSAIAFFATNKWSWLKEGSTVEAAFHLAKNVWQDQASVQLVILDMRPSNE